MSVFRKLFWSGSILTLCAGSAFAGVHVSSPGNGATVSSPFTLSAWAADCSSQPIAAIGYSFDNSTSNRRFHAASIDGPVSAPVGWHTLHVKAWGIKGAACVTDVSIEVQQNTLMTGLAIPIWATSVSSIQALDNWAGASDTEASGSSDGTTSIVSLPSLFRQYPAVQCQFPELWRRALLYQLRRRHHLHQFRLRRLGLPRQLLIQIANLEFDLNQVMDNGQTVIFGVQCDGWTNTWDYTANTGTPTNYVDVWAHSPQPCNPRTWSINTWHNVQIAYSRDSNGVVTYKTVSLDGVTGTINVTVPSAFALGWGPTLLTNFQVDGDSASGSATAWLDSLTIYSW